MGISAEAGGRGLSEAFVTGCAMLAPPPAQMNSGSPLIGAEMPCPLCFIAVKNAAIW